MPKPPMTAEQLATFKERFRGTLLGRAAENLHEANSLLSRATLKADFQKRQEAVEERYRANAKWQQAKNLFEAIDARVKELRELDRKGELKSKEGRALFHELVGENPDVANLAAVARNRADLSDFHDEVLRNSADLGARITRQLEAARRAEREKKETAEKYRAALVGAK